MPAAGTEEKKSTLINISLRRKKRSRQEKDVLKTTRHKNAWETEIHC